VHRYFIAILIATFCSLGFSLVDDGEIGAGGGVGNLLNLNAKFWRSSSFALETKLSVSGQNWFLIGGAFHKHHHNLFEFENDLDMNYGAGIFAYFTDARQNPFLASDADFEDEFGLAPYAKIGLSYTPREVPFEFYMDGGLGINVAPVINLFPLFELGARINLMSLGSKN
jgi:hypothetical protein